MKPSALFTEDSRVEESKRKKWKKKKITKIHGEES